MANPVKEYADIVDDSNKKRLDEIIQSFTDAGLLGELKEFMFIRNFPFKAYDERKLNG